MTKVRIFSLDDTNVAELSLRRRERPALRNDDREEPGVMRRKREETASRRHVFLHQTLPPNDPFVREVERRRAGGDDQE